MDSRFLNRAGVVGLMAALISGCSDAVQFTRETANGGIVTYLYKEDRGGPMGSPHRKQALQMIDAKCPAGYFVVRDGEVTGTPIISGLEGQESEGTGRRWGIQFRCK
jgi:hypothetical protein